MTVTTVTVTNTWTGGGTYLGTNFTYHPDPQGSGASVTRTPAIPTEGRYRVYTRWAAASTYASNATFTVHHAGGSSAVAVNQTIGGGQWNLLGDYDMEPGQSHRVVVSDTGADGFVIADAVRLVHIGDSRRIAADAVNPGLNPGDAEDVMYVHADHLGSAQKMTSNSGAVLWDAAFTPFGLEDSITGTAANDNRFPGQRFDAETALHYNYFRDYDPSAGRYIQSDPIGLVGGLNTFAYVGGNPISRTDSLGLIFYNNSPPITVPVTGNTAQQLQCVENCLGANNDHGGKGLLCTGGKEQSGHNSGSKHYSNDAADVAGQAFNNYPTGAVLICAAKCGFSHGWYEDKPGYRRDHWHLQNGPGLGVPPLPNPNMTPIPKPIPNTP